MQKVLIIEDDNSLNELIEIHVKDLGYQVACTFSGESGLDYLENNQIDLIILDLMLPGINGMEVCRQIRRTGNNVPVIMLTAKADEMDIVLGLEAGADDYITKPFSIRELLARINANLRRQLMKDKEKEVKLEYYSFGGLEIDVAKRKVELDASLITLTKKEFDLLYYLAKNPGINYSRSQLLRDVWGYNYEGYEHTVNAHINRLRAKIEKDMSEPNFILTTWGVGYRFNENI